MARKISFYASLIIFSATALMFAAFLSAGFSTDISTHALTVVGALDGTLAPPANILYYLVIYSLTLFSSDIRLLYISSVFVLSFAVVAKFLVTYRFALFYAGKWANRVISPEYASFLVLISAMLILTFSLPLGMLANGQFYLGQVTPNVWHNSTTIFLMPFALMLFWLSYEQLVNPTKSRIVSIALLCILNALIKPSFLFVFFPLYPLLLLRRFGLTRQLWLNLIPIVISLVLLAGEYSLIYVYGFGDLYAEKSQITLSVFKAWSRFSNNIPLALFGSIIFPLTYLCFYWKELLDNLLLQYAVSAYVISVAVFSLLAEIGGREGNGNFYWQAVVCAYILFMAISFLFFEKIELARGRNLTILKSMISDTDWKQKIVLLSFLLHFVSGIVYLIKFLTTGSYLG